MRVPVSGRLRSLLAAAFLVAVSLGASAAVPPPALGVCLPSPTVQCWTVTFSPSDAGVGDIDTYTDATFATKTSAIACHRQSLDTTGTCSHIYQVSSSATSIPIYVGIHAGSGIQASHGCLEGEFYCYTATTSWTGTLTIAGSQVFTPNFTLDDPRTIGVSVVQSGWGTVTSSPTGLTCPSVRCSDSYNAGQPLTLTAQPASSGYVFSAWDGAGPCAGQGATCSFTLSANTTVTATFALTPTPAPSLGPTPSTGPTPTPSTTAAASGGPGPTPVGPSGSAGGPGGGGQSSAAAPTVGTDGSATPSPSGIEGVGAGGTSASPGLTDLGTTGAGGGVPSSPGLVEYSIILALIAVLVISVLVLRSKVIGPFVQMQSGSIPDAKPGPTTNAGKRATQLKQEMSADLQKLVSLTTSAEDPAPPTKPGRTYFDVVQGDKGLQAANVTPLAPPPPPPHVPGDVKWPGRPLKVSDQPPPSGSGGTSAKVGSDPQATTAEASATASETAPQTSIPHKHLAGTKYESVSTPAPPDPTSAAEVVPETPPAATDPGTTGSQTLSNIEKVKHDTITGTIDNIR